jgi:hypothetical protein
VQEVSLGLLDDLLGQLTAARRASGGTRGGLGDLLEQLQRADFSSLQASVESLAKRIGTT